MLFPSIPARFLCLFESQSCLKCPRITLCVYMTKSPMLILYIYLFITQTQNMHTCTFTDAHTHTHRPTHTHTHTHTQTRSLSFQTNDICYISFFYNYSSLDQVVSPNISLSFFTRGKNFGHSNEFYFVTQ